MIIPQNYNNPFNIHICYFYYVRIYCRYVIRSSNIDKFSMVPGREVCNELFSLTLESVSAKAKYEEIKAADRTSAKAEIRENTSVCL